MGRPDCNVAQCMPRHLRETVRTGALGQPKVHLTGRHHQRQSKQAASMTSGRQNSLPYF